MKIYLAGHRGMVGGAIFRRLQTLGADVVTRTHDQLDLTDQAAVKQFFRDEKPDAVILAAAKVGGIHANDTYPASFIYHNLMIEANVIHQAYEANVAKLLFLGSSCIYPRDAAQPMAENALLTGPLEATNEPYAIAKIAGIKLCESYNRQYGTDYRSLMPTNLYGPGDNFHPENSHVLPALMRRFHEAVASGAEQVAIWGSGKPRREFLHVDDLAEAALFLMTMHSEAYQKNTSVRQSHINVGTGEDISIAELACLMAETTGFHGTIAFDPTKPDGTPRKLLNVELLGRMGWRAKIPLKQGVAQTYQWFLKNSHRQ